MYSSKNEASVLDGGQIGSSLNPETRKILNTLRDHDPAYFSNHLVDVFCANSLPLTALENGLQQRIDAIVGKENTFIIDNRLFCFSLPNLDRITSMYRVKDRKMIRQLRNCLQEQQ